MSLTREQKEHLATLLKQKALLKQENKLSEFKPNVGAQEAYFRSPAKVRLLCGGNGIGKTTAIAVELIWTHLKCHPHRQTLNTNHTWILIPGYDKVEDYWREIRRWCPPSKLPDPDKMGTSSIRRLRWTNGNTSTFYSMDQDPLKLEGTNFDALFIDEPPPRALYIAAYRGLRNNPDYFVSFACTPLSEPWLYTEVYLPGVNGTDPNIEVFQGSSYENKHLSEAYIEDFKSRLTDDEIRTRIHGEFASLQGRVFKEFSRPSHVIKTQDWPEEWPVWAGIDPHTRKPNTTIWVGITPDDNLVVINECQVEGIPELAAKIKQIEKENRYRVVARRVDNSGSGLDWSRDSAVDHLLKAGVRVSPMKNREKNVDDGIHKIRMLLKGQPDKCGKLIPGLKIFDRCKKTIEDLELYSWHESRHPDKTGIAEKPRKIHDDMIDPLRYIIMSRPAFNGRHEPLDYVHFKDKREPRSLQSALKNIFKET
jgi:phage terminase large subunit-like protein